MTPIYFQKHPSPVARDGGFHWIPFGRHVPLEVEELSRAVLTGRAELGVDVRQERSSGSLTVLAPFRATLNVRQYEGLSGFRVVRDASQAELAWRQTLPRMFTSMPLPPGPWTPEGMPAPIGPDRALDLDTARRLAGAWLGGRMLSLPGWRASELLPALGRVLAELDPWDRAGIVLVSSEGPEGTARVPALAAAVARAVTDASPHGPLALSPRDELYLAAAAARQLRCTVSSVVADLSTSGRGFSRHARLDDDRGRELSQALAEVGARLSDRTAGNAGSLRWSSDGAGGREARRAGALLTLLSSSSLGAGLPPWARELSRGPSLLEGCVLADVYDDPPVQAAWGWQAELVFAGELDESEAVEPWWSRAHAQTRVTP